MIPFQKKFHIHFMVKEEHISLFLYIANNKLGIKLFISSKIIIFTRNEVSTIYITKLVP